MTKLLFAY